MTTSDPRDQLREAAVASAEAADLVRKCSELSLFSKVAVIEACRNNPYQPPVLWHQTIFGSMMQLDLREIVSQQIFLTGAFEPDLLWFITCVVPEGATVIDGGAHIGFFSLALAQVVGPSGRVDSFEPVAATKIHLDTNVRNNHAAHVFTNGLALWSANEMLSLNVLGPALSAYNGVGKPRLPQQPEPGATGKIDVAAVSIDAFTASAGLSPAFVKLDVESAELEVLKGMTRTLAEARPIVALEIGDIEGTGAPRTAEILKLLVDASYTVFELKSCRLSPLPVEDRSYAYANVAALPNEKVADLAGLIAHDAS